MSTLIAAAAAVAVAITVDDAARRVGSRSLRSAVGSDGASVRSARLVGSPPPGPTAARTPVVLVLLVAGAGALAWAVAGPAGAVLVPAVATVGIHRRRQRSERRRQRTRDRVVPDVIELCVLLARADLSMRQVVAELAAHGPPVARPAMHDVQSRIERGDSVADALATLPDTLGPGIRPMVDLIVPATRYGHSLAPALEQLALEARRSRQRLDEAAARRLPVQLSFPLVACTLPSFVLLAVAPVVLAALSSLGQSW